MATIVVDQLQKTYREGWLRRKEFTALRGISFTVEEGEIFGLLGQNGAGKTTFIKILLGIIRKSGGTATLLDFPAGDRRARKRVGYVPENLRVPRHLTGYTALELYGQLSGLSPGQVRHRRGAVLERVGLVERAKDPVRTYSKGMLQRLGLAQAMLHEPDVFILDEPTDGLDPLARHQVRRTLAELKKQGKTIFLNSHILQEVELICDRVAILDRGNLKFCGKVSELTTDRSLANAATGQTNGQQYDIHWELIGTEDALRAALSRCPTRDWQPIGQTRWRVVSVVQQADEIDQLIDELRSRGISIQGLAPKKASLEEAYAEIVAEAAE
jgi:ABC-2 type transport system ATP-binding protein